MTATLHPKQNKSQIKVAKRKETETVRICALSVDPDTPLLPSFSCSLITLTVMFAQYDKFTWMEWADHAERIGDTRMCVAVNRL